MMLCQYRCKECGNERWVDPGTGIATVVPTCHGNMIPTGVFVSTEQRTSAAEQPDKEGK